MVLLQCPDLSFQIITYTFFGNVGNEKEFRAYVWGLFLINNLGWHFENLGICGNYNKIKKYCINFSLCNHELQLLLCKLAHMEVRVGILNPVLLVPQRKCVSFFQRFLQLIVYYVRDNALQVFHKQWLSGQHNITKHYFFKKRQN